MGAIIEPPVTPFIPRRFGKERKKYQWKPDGQVIPLQPHRGRVRVGLPALKEPGIMLVTAFSLQCAPIVCNWSSMNGV